MYSKNAIIIPIAQFQLKAVWPVNEFVILLTIALSFFY